MAGVCFAGARVCALVNFSDPERKEAMGKSSKGKGGYRPAPWSNDYAPNKKGGKSPWYRKKPSAKAPWSDPLAPLRGGGR